MKLANPESSTEFDGITILDTTPPAAVTDLTASNPTGTSMDLTWTAPGDDANAGTASTCDIRYSTANMTSASLMRIIVYSVNLYVPLFVF